MRGPRSTRAHFASLILVLGACDSGGTECTCPATGLTVTLPSSLAGEVTSIQPTGPACADAGIDPAPGPATKATVFRITPTQPGQCQLDIFFNDEPSFSDSLTVVQTTGCCAGLRTSPPAAALIDVPAPEDGGEDAALD